MTAKLIDGTEVASEIRQECRAHTDKLRAAGITPGLAVIMVGDDPASAVYVRKKIQACADVGIASRKHLFPANATQHEVVERIGELSTDPAAAPVRHQGGVERHSARKGCRRLPSL